MRKFRTTRAFQERDSRCQVSKNQILKQTLVTLLMFSIALEIRAQELSFDFQTKSFEGSKYAMYQDDILVTVSNVNLNKYQVTFEVDRINYTYTKDGASGGETASHDATQTGENVLTNDSSSVEEKIALFDSIKSEVLKHDFKSDISAFKKQSKSDITLLEAQNFLNEKAPSFNERKNRAFSQVKNAKLLLNEIKLDLVDTDYFKIKGLEAGFAQCESVCDDAIEAANALATLDSSNFSARHIIPNVKDDELVVKIVFEEKSTKSKEEYAFTIKVKGKFKIDFSTGAVFNLGDGDENFFIESDSLIGKGRTDKITPIYPVVLTHFYFRNAKNYNFGGSVGLGLTEEQKASFYLALSCFIGNNQRLVLSAGTSIRPLKSLKHRFDVGQVVDTESITLDDLDNRHL